MKTLKKASLKDRWSEMLYAFLGILKIPGLWLKINLKKGGGYENKK
jgi:hypothetical protein